MSVRALAAGEWRVWRDLRLRALADAPDAFGGELAAARARTDAAWLEAAEPRPDRVQLIAERGGAPAGMVAAVVADDGRRADLHAMWVAPEARGEGLGRALVDRAIAWARGRALSSIELRVSDRAPAASAVYREAGFADTGRREPLRAGSSIEAGILELVLRPLVMGVVNVTPDSFSDGGTFLDPAAAIRHGQELARAGADILDVGGEATNPRAVQVDAAEELRRVLPVVEALSAGGAIVSVDTTKAAVARAVVAAGASIINDISGGLFDPAMADAVAELDVTYIAGHLRGTNLAEVFAAELPAGGAPRGGALGGTPASWREVAAELESRLAPFPPAVRARCWVDPGIGFGKGADPETNMALLIHAGDIGRALGRPVVVGPSRKRFLRTLVGAGADTMTLDVASMAACLRAARGGAQVLRAHNVALLGAALAVYTRM